MSRVAAKTVLVAFVAVLGVVKFFTGFKLERSKNSVYSYNVRVVERHLPLPNGSLTWNRPVSNSSSCWSYGSMTFSRGPAYLDLRVAKPVVRILLYGPNYKSLTGDCTFPLPNDRTLKIDAKFTVFDHYAKWRVNDPEIPHWPLFMLCDIPSNSTSLLSSVIVSFDHHVFPNIVVDGRFAPRCVLPIAVVQRPADAPTPTRRLDVCVKTMHNGFRAWWQIFIFIEWWRYAGADHFWVYRHSATEDTDRVLHYYQNMGILSILPSSSELETSNRAVQHVQIHDCILRTSNHAIFAALVDWDEHIVFVDSKLNRERYLLDYVAREARAHPNLGGWQFRHVATHSVPHFHKFTNASTTLNASSLQDLSSYLALMACEMRVGQPWKVNERSKMVIRPERVLRKVVHFVDEYIEPKKHHTKVLPTDYMLLMHVRPTPLGYDDSKKMHSPFADFNSVVTQRILDNIVAARSQTKA